MFRAVEGGTMFELFGLIILLPLVIVGIVLWALSSLFSVIGHVIGAVFGALFTVFAALAGVFLLALPVLFVVALVVGFAALIPVVLPLLLLGGIVWLVARSGRAPRVAPPARQAAVPAV
jgi:hypothetical protein